MSQSERKKYFEQEISWRQCRKGYFCLLNSRDRAVYSHVNVTCFAAKHSKFDSRDSKVVNLFFISAFHSLCMKDFHRTALLESKFHFEIKRLIFFNGRLIRSNEFDFWHTINQRQSLHMHVCIYYKEHTCNDKFLMCLVLVSKKINKSKNRETETHL